MAESIFLRVRRVMSGNVEDMVDNLEKSNSPAVMREALREVDRAYDEVRADQEGAVAKKLQAQRQQAKLRERAAELEGKARFALGEGREDLAEAALSRQIEFEERANSLDAVQQQADDEAQRLAECLAALAERRKLMKDELDAFELAQQDARVTDEDGATRTRRTVERRVEQAEQAFERAMGGTGVAGVTRGDAKTAASVAELDLLQKRSLVADRLAALKTETKAAA